MKSRLITRFSFQPARWRQSGLSLIELMVAITIGLLVVLALIASFISFSRNSRELSKSNSMIENGRLAVYVMQNDMQHAGFWDGYVPKFDNLAWKDVPNDVPGSIPDVCLPYASWNDNYKTSLIGIPLQVYDTAPSSCSTVIASKKTSSDILIVRHAETCTPGESNCGPEVGGSVYFQASRCSEDTVPYIIDSDAAKFTLRNMACPPILPPPAAPPAFASKRKFISNIYYIRDYSNAPGDGIPTLVHSSFDLASGSLAYQAAVPLVEGVEGLRIELGIDNLGKTNAAVKYSEAVKWQDASNKNTPTNRGDGAPDGDFVSCSSASPCTVDQLTNAVAAKIYLLARNLDPTPGYTDSKTYHLGKTTLGPFNDGYKRHLFTTTVRLVNISARRETP